MADKYDIAIIGGGPAGSSAAMFLTERGFSVCIFEKKKFPRETLCGEFLSYEVTEQLKKLDLFFDFLRLSPNSIKSFRFVNDDGKYVDTTLGFTGHGIKRGKFDEFLLNAAKARGVDVFQPYEVKEFLKNNDGFLIYADNKDNAQQVCANKIIGAYGKQNILDKKLSRSLIGERSLFNGIKFHADISLFNNLDKNTIQIFSGKDIYCGINAVDDNMVTVCFLENRYNEKINSKERLKNLIGNNTAMRLLFKEEIDEIIDQSIVYGTGNIYFGKRELVKDGIYMIGDTAHVIAPLAGDGIGMAIENGELIAEILREQREKQLSNKQIEMLYQKRWESLFNKRIRTANIIQNIILSNSWRKIGFRFIQFYPRIINHFVKTTRSDSQLFMPEV